MIFYVILSLILIFLASVCYRRRKFIDSLPPGPPAWPIIGNLFQFDESDKRKTFRKWHKLYGPVFTMWMGWKPDIVVTGFDAINEIFVKNSDNFLDRPVGSVGSVLSLFELLLDGPYGILVSSGDRMQEQRRFALQLLRSLGMGKKIMEHNISEEAEKMIHGIEHKMQTFSNQFDVTKFFRLAVANIISSLLVGRKFTSDDDPTFVQLDEVNKEFETLSEPMYVILQLFPWLKHVPLFGHFGYDEILRQRQKWVDLITKEIDERKKSFLEIEDPSDFVSAYFKEMARRKQTNENPGFFDEWQMISVLIDMWNAGYETTVLTMCWQPLLMIRYPQVQRKVQQELDHIVGRERLPSMSDRPHLPYTNAVLLEMQRYSNILPVNDGRVAKNEIVFDGCRIPKGTSVIPYLATVHMDETIFHRPEEFIPERFLEPDGKTTKKNLCDQVIQFSVGKRNCIGEGLAKMELFLFFTSLMHKFSLEYIPGKPEPSLVPVAEVFMRPRPYECKITLRR